MRRKARWNMGAGNGGPFVYNYVMQHPANDRLLGTDYYVNTQYNVHCENDGGRGTSLQENCMGMEMLKKDDACKPDGGARARYEGHTGGCAGATETCFYYDILANGSVPFNDESYFDWSVKWDDLDVDEVLVTTGDCTRWAVMSMHTVEGFDGVTHGTEFNAATQDYPDFNISEEPSSSNPPGKVVVVSQTKDGLCLGVASDTGEDSGANSGETAGSRRRGQALYGEASAGSYDWRIIVATGGNNVYVRKKNCQIQVNDKDFTTKCA